MAGNFRPQIVDRNTTPVRTTPKTPKPTATGTSPPPKPTQSRVSAPHQPINKLDGNAGGAITPVADDATLLARQANTARFAALNASALEAALAAIEAQFGLTREQLLADRSAIGQEYQLLFAQAQRAREQGLEQTTQGFQERGLVRSGLHAEGLANTELAFAEQLAGLEGGRASQFAGIDSQLAALQGQEAFARLQAEQEAELRLLDQEVMALLLEAGL